MRPNKPNWMFRVQRLAVDPFNIFSKYTPAKPLLQHARRTAPKPRAALCSMSSEDFSVDLLLFTWTMATPAKNNNLLEIVDTKKKQCFKKIQFSNKM